MTNYIRTITESIEGLSRQTYWYRRRQVLLSQIAMTHYLRYKAGSAVINMIRESGFDLTKNIRAFVGPAGGPKWFVSVGFDKALMRHGLLEKTGGRVLLAGSSAGAWRCLAMACKDPPTSYENLRLAYSRNVFTAEHNPGSISDTLKQNVDKFLRDEDIPFVVQHPIFDIAVHTAMAKGMAASKNQRVEGLALLLCGLFNAVIPNGVRLFYERVVFLTGRNSLSFMEHGFRGKVVNLNRHNLKIAALATGSLPYVVAGVEDIPGAPTGIYRDGGLTDYHLNQEYIHDDKGITLLFHHQERIVPGWFDKHLSWRKPSERSIERVLQVYPTEDFVKLLPGNRIPDRTDFKTFVNDPAERIRRWDKASKLSEILGEEFAEAVYSGKISKEVNIL